MVIYRSCPVNSAPRGNGAPLITGSHIHPGWEGVRLMAESVEFFDDQGHLVGIV